MPDPAFHDPTPATKGDLNRLSKAYERFSDRTRKVLIVLVAIQLVVGGLAVYLLTQNSQRTKDIQASRREGLVRLCRDENAHNAAAVKFIKNLPPPPGQPKPTSKLIHGFANALVGPVHKDCEAFADQALGG
jgi:hypothetical protein